MASHAVMRIEFDLAGTTLDLAILIVLDLSFSHPTSPDRNVSE
jgi:hypothetical protein